MRHDKPSERSFDQGVDGSIPTGFTNAVLENWMDGSLWCALFDR